MSILRELANIYLIQKRNPFHDELGGEKFKTARSNFAQKRKEVKNAPERVQRLRDVMDARKPKENEIEKENILVKDILPSHMKNKSNEQFLQEYGFEKPKENEIPKLNDGRDFNKFKKDEIEYLTQKNKEGINYFNNRIKIHEGLLNGGSNDPIQKNFIKGLKSGLKDLESGDDLNFKIGKLKDVFFDRYFFDKRSKAQKSELAMQVIRKYQGY